MNVPLALLQNWRLPDRDLHRILALYGPLSTRDLQQRTRLAHYTIENALNRMAKYRIVTAEPVKRGQQFHNLWRAA